MSDQGKLQEFIIIKRGNFEEEGHHGGAWKIAFADFMTAMMALFLVLWLINAANEETKKAVASYFNPVKLVDKNRSIKGLHDAEGVQDVEVKAPNEQYPEQELNSSPTKSLAESEAQFFADPFSVLDEIAAHQAPGLVKHIEEEGGRNGNQAINDAQGGESFMDPFSPNFWNEEVRPSNDARQLNGRYDTTGEFEALDDKARMQKVVEGGEGTEEEGFVEAATTQGKTEIASGADADAEVETAALPRSVKDAGIAPDGSEANKNGTNAGEATEITDGENTDQGSDPARAASKTPGEEMASETPAEKETAAANQRAEAIAEELRRKIGESLEESLGADVSLVSDLTIVTHDEGILISLTDGFEIPMFGIGSAVPTRDLVVALEKIGAILTEQDGNIRIRGHTDARPFRSEDYDNWRLSAARAQSAYYMLLRGGLDEMRVREISGFADRQLLDPEDPFSNRNRRIEVLVEVPDA